jgi:putative flippase GtrA
LVVRQLLTYAVTGAFLAGIGQGSYLAFVELAHFRPVAAIIAGTALALGIGYFAHGKITFAGAAGGNGHRLTFTRFLVVNSIGFLLNMFWVWLLAERLQTPTWVPIVPNVTLTPIITFLLHRRWTYI